mmetsp:Transcript_36448/g.53380  ORF Transcript_36448/g.53380 Transcript_36448/m.53380 type:complete len:95 (+) Transcript_36448:1113-1397(+)
MKIWLVKVFCRDSLIKKKGTFGRKRMIILLVGNGKIFCWKGIKLEMRKFGEVSQKGRFVVFEFVSYFCCYQKTYKSFDKCMTVESTFNNNSNGI